MISDFNHKFRVADFLVFEKSTWRLSVRPRQVTLGSLVLSSARPDAQLSSLTQEESADLGPALKTGIEAIETLFAPRVINVLGLMLVDPWLHFHLIPRYDGQRDFAGKRWVDLSFPKMLDSLSGEDDFSRHEILQELKETFRRQISQNTLEIP